MYEMIRTFSPIFRGLKFENPRAASIYYVNLIINFPTNFQGILKQAQMIYGNEISRQALQSGRQELLENGIIARTYFTEDADVDFDREMYLPVNPEIIWEENLDKAKLFWKRPEESDFRKSNVRDLHDYFIKNFKKYGLGTEKGSVSGLFNIRWMWRHGVNVYNYTSTKRVDAILNGLEQFMVPEYLDKFETLLRQGMKERIIYDMNTKRKMLKDEVLKFKEYGPVIEQRLNRYKKLYNDYHDQIEIRYTPLAYTTTRQAICYNDNGPYFACDFRNLLSLDSRGPPYYMGTFYLQEDLIYHIKEGFDAAWANSNPLDELYHDETLAVE
jgi:hypothetical protein